METSEQVREAMAWALNWAKSTETFVVEQTPIFIEETLRWGFWSSLMQSLIGLILIANAVWGARRLWKLLMSNASDSDAYALYTIVSIFGGVYGFFEIVFGFEWLQILIAPRTYLVEHFSNLIK